MVAISAWWTPNHLDVTHVPMTYAKPKAAWIDRYATLRKGLSSDAAERMQRRREHDRSVVDPNEIGVLPPLPVAPPAPQRSKVTFVKSILRTSVRPS
jgi:hypothetical protein